MGSAAIAAVASRTSRASPSAASAARWRSPATCSAAASTRRACASWSSRGPMRSPGAGSSMASGMSTTGPTTVPGHTPMPVMTCRASSSVPPVTTLAPRPPRACDPGARAGAHACPSRSDRQAPCTSLLRGRCGAASIR
ncbi:Uncharacterised protein [Mycobacteroides abscessus]|nr:Uncharacterised protein [Mycobacteroides abscessus]